MGTTMTRATKVFEWKLPFWWPWASQMGKFALISTGDSLKECGGATGNSLGTWF